MSVYNQSEITSRPQVNPMHHALESEQATRQFITVDGLRIAYRAAGNPAHSALLMVHGWLSHAGFWHDIIERFKDTHYCVAIDLAGFGFSDKPGSGDYSIPAQAKRVLALADRLNIREFVLAGHSMGGQIALYLAIHAPERVQKLMTIGGVVTGALASYFRNIYRGPLWIGYHVPKVWMVSRFGLRHVRPYKWIFTDFAMTYQRDMIAMGSVDMEMALVEGIERPAYLAFHAIQHCDLTPDLSRITAPALIIHGEQDNTVPVSSARTAHEHIPGSKLVIFDRCGHVPHLEVPALFMAAMTEFLTQGQAISCPGRIIELDN